MTVELETAKSREGATSAKAEGISFVCPTCKGSLTREPEAYRCRKCPRDYPIMLGIPDFRVSDDRSRLESEDRKAIRLAQEFGHRSFIELLELYYRISPDVPPKLASRWVQHSSSGLARARRALEEIDGYRTAQAGGAFMEIGCGSGEFLVAAAGEFDTVVGVDIALPWLILAKKQIEESGRDAILTCASADQLPFPADSFRVAVARDVIEHVPSPGGLLRESHRVLARGGLVFLATPNRWSLALEPHVKLWGVGFLPKALRDRYVRLVRRVSFQDVNTLNYFEIRKLLSQSGFTRCDITLPRLHAEHAARMGSLERMAVPIYNTAKELLPVRWLLYLFGPLFHIVCTKTVGERR